MLKTLMQFTNGGVKLKILPNILSCSRIVLSLLLLFAVDTPVCFTILYLVCGLTDVADGYLARAWDATTKLGSKLDSAGDLIFFAVWVYVFCNVKNDSLQLTVTWMIIVAAVRAANFLITRVKFGEWGMTHTLGNKLTGLALFIALPFFILIGNAPLWGLWVIGFIAAISAVEETVILLRSTKYDADRRSLLLK